jgi:hypothetical protein
MALYNEQPYHYVMLAMTFHPLAYLLEWSSPFQIGFEERLVVVCLKKIRFLKRLISSGVRLV